MSGSPIYAGHRPARDAECVARIRRGGGIPHLRRQDAQVVMSHGKVGIVFQQRGNLLNQLHFRHLVHFGLDMPIALFEFR